MNCISKQTVCGREGWTPAAITNFLGEADKTSTNPRFKKAPAMKLYYVSRIEEVEKTEQFKVFVAKSKGRKISASKAVVTKIEKAKLYANTLALNIPDYEKETLLQKACDHFNQRNSYNEGARFEWRNGDCLYQGEWQEASLTSGTDFLIRITVNYIRHCLTPYDEILKKNFGVTGKDAAYEVLKERINREALEKYQWLNDTELTKSLN